MSRRENSISHSGSPARWPPNMMDICPFFGGSGWSCNAGCLAGRKSEIFLRNGEFRTAHLHLQFLIRRKQRKKPKTGDKKKTGEGEKDKTKEREKEKTPLNDRKRQ